MAASAKFNISFLKGSSNAEHMFVSVTPGFEHGPGIQRDGITAPRMRDPHSVPFVCHARGIVPNHDLPSTTDPYIQRAGTWTLYHHLKSFLKHRGDQWTVIAAQSCGDLTMNPWHVAYLGNSHIPNQNRTLCGLLTQNDHQEPIGSRIYRCIVKWNSGLTPAPAKPYQAVDLTFHEVPSGYAVTIKNASGDSALTSWLSSHPSYNSTTGDVAPLLEFALSGKPVVEKADELSLSNAIDRFQDIRHVFNLPTVKARGLYRGENVPEINFGEYQLFQNLNERRAALSSAVIIDLRIGDFVTVEWEDLRAKLLERHYKETRDSPTRRGFFRRYSDDITRDKVEIFFPHNVYPFGVLGIHADAIVCLASGGLSGRVGNTLEGITRIMFDFFGCEDALVLDEGYDTFQLINPPVDGGSYLYDNETLARKVLGFTKQMSDKEHNDSMKTVSAYHFKGGLQSWPLNKSLWEEINQDVTKIGTEDFSDIMAVSPNRAQMRSVVIFACPKS